MVPAPIALVLALQVAPSPPVAPASAAPALQPAPSPPVAPALQHAPSSATTPAPAAAALARDDLGHRRLVFAANPGLEFGVRYPVPSGALALFLGTDLRPRLDRRGRARRAALGYQLTLSLGHADLVFAESPRNRGLAGFVSHRHALALLGRAGARERLIYGLALAAVFGGAAPVGFDGELRLGHALGARPGRRAEAQIGGLVRVGAPFGGPLLPQFGVFLGVLVF